MRATGNGKRISTFPSICVCLLAAAAATVIAPGGQAATREFSSFTSEGREQHKVHERPRGILINPTRHTLLANSSLSTREGNHFPIRTLDRSTFVLIEFLPCLPVSERVAPKVSSTIHQHTRTLLLLLLLFGVLHKNKDRRRHCVHTTHYFGKGRCARMCTGVAARTQAPASSGPGGKLSNHCGTLAAAVTSSSRFVCKKSLFNIHSPSSHLRARAPRFQVLWFVVGTRTPTHTGLHARTPTLSVRPR